MQIATLSVRLDSIADVLSVLDRGIILSSLILRARFHSLTFLLIVSVYGHGYDLRLI